MSQFDKSFTRKNTLLMASAAVALSFVAAPAFAQSVDCSKVENSAKEECKSSVVTVVGSRIRKNEFNNSSPIQVITSEETTLKGQKDAANVLQTSTTAAGSFQINSTFTGFVTEGGPGTNSISLRGLGSQRSLILLNGKRLPPSGTRGQVGAVDLNTIPNSMIDRYEILKDGASTVYGSDAIGGVINLITKKNQKGGKVGVYYNGTVDGGGEQLVVDGSYGWNFDKGNIIIGAEYYDRKDLKAGDRDWAGCQEDYIFDQTTGARVDMIDPATGSYKCFNQWQGTVRVLNGANRGEWIPTPGSTGAIPGWTQIRSQTGTITPAATYLAKRPYYTDRNKERSILSPVTRSTFYATGNYQLPFGEDVEISGEAFYNRRESEQFNYRQIFGFGGQAIAASNTAYNPFGGNADTVALFPFNSAQEVETTRYNLGIKGGFGDGIGFMKDWQWNAYVQYGKGSGTYGQDVIKNAEFTAAVAGCPTGSPAGCLQFDWLNADGILNGNWNPQQLAYFTAYDVGKTVYEQKIAELAVDGTLFALPAGDLKFATGVHWRQESINDVPGPVSLAGNLAGSTGALITKGKDTLREGFLELDVPLLAKVPLVERLTLNASGRYTDYDSYGSDTVYKLGVNWQITPEVRLTWTKGTNYRAPALYELFLGNQTGFLGQGSIDPCIDWASEPNTIIQANCAADGIPNDYAGVGSSATIYTGGGYGVLEAETAKNMTFGINWIPDKIAGLKTNLTYWDIEINNAVSQLGASNILYLCYSGRTAFCSLFTRNNDATSADYHRIVDVRNSYVNVASSKARGIDLEAEYTKIFSLGKLGVEVSASWSLEHNDELLGDKTRYNGAIYEPSFVGETSIFFKRGDWTYYWDFDVIGKASNNAIVNEYYAGNADLVYNRTGTAVVRVKAQTETSITHNASVRYKNDDWSVQVGVQNIFDEAPPAVSGLQVVSWYSRLGNSVVGGPYDTLGRRLYIDFKKNF